MPQTAVLTREPVAPPVRPQRRALADIKARTAGLGAIGFVVVVVLQNIVRGLSAPANDAPTREVLNHYADHRAVTAVLACTFVLGGIALAGFLGGAMRRLTAGDRPGWAYIGAIGAIGIMVIFAVLVGIDEALSVVATGTKPDLASMDALWALHNSVFTHRSPSPSSACPVRASRQASRRPSSSGSRPSASCCSRSRRLRDRSSRPATPCRPSASARPGS